AAIAPVISARNPLVPLLPAVALEGLALGAWVASRTTSASSLAGRLAAAALLLNVPGARFVPVFVRSFVVSERVDLAAPDFAMALLDGGDIEATALRGRVVVLDFWATWCIPCRREMPELEAVRRRYASRPDVAFYAVNL